MCFSVLIAHTGRHSDSERCLTGVSGYSFLTALYFPSKRNQAELLTSLGLDATVTRREDATFAPNGYIYNVYFDGAKEDATDVPELAADGVSCAGAEFDAPDETVGVTTVTQGTTAGGILTDTLLPFGDIDDSSLEGT